ncbi:hypothetical protein ABT214_03615 [Micromonospora purpureochromogenes]|uniref:hypothetical protein n=1 Tax=Micromonospora purpureochromogenes TaxID=47872 RepID=UPI003322B61D
MVLASIVAVVAFLAWLTVARLRWLTGVVLAALLLVALGIVALAAVQPRAALEARVLLVLGAAATLLAARVIQRRRLGADENGGPRWRWPYRIAVGLALVIACGGVPLGAKAVSEDGFVPSVRELGTLPEDLALRGDGPEECGQGGCAVRYRVAGRPGEPAEQVAGRMWKHLAGRGWPAGDGGRSCRPVGWLLDNRETCVWLSTPEGVARLTLSGGRPYPTYNELRYSGP